jgi:hypothetical protein
MRHRDDDRGLLLKILIWLLVAYLMVVGVLKSTDLPFIFS